MKNLILALGVVGASMAVVSCDLSSTGSTERWSPAELDSTIEEVWIGDSEGTVISLGQWLKSDPENTLEWISRKDALALHGEAKKKFGVDLSVISDPDLPNYTVSIVAKIPEGTDRDALRALLESVPSRYQVDLQLGNKWLALDGLLGDGGEYVPK